MNFKYLFVVCVLLIFTTMGAEYVIEQPKELPKKVTEEVFKIIKKNVKVKETFEERKKRLDAICEEMLEYGTVYPVVYGPHIWLGKKIAWGAENFVRPDGWQLSGWSKVTLNEKFNIRRIKIGIISSEMHADEIIRMHNDRVRWDRFNDWKERNSELTLGIYISWEF